MDLNYLCQNSRIICIWFWGLHAVVLQCNFRLGIQKSLLTRLGGPSGMPQIKLELYPVVFDRDGGKVIPGNAPGTSAGLTAKSSGLTATKAIPSGAGGMS